MNKSTLADESPTCLVDASRFVEPGLYLILQDGKELVLTRPEIEKLAKEYLADRQKLPDDVRDAVEFGPCTICPMHDTAELCHAIPTVFPLLEDRNRYVSHDPVTAIFRSEASDASGAILHVVQTTMQRALQHISILGLMYYCEVGRKYYKYFSGVIPFMGPKEIAERLYLNLYWEQGGDTDRVEAIIQKMHSEIAITTHCQMKRVRLMCKSDAIANAFVNTQVATEILEIGVETFLRKRMSDQDKAQTPPG